MHNPIAMSIDDIMPQTAAEARENVANSVYADFGLRFSHFKPQKGSGKVNCKRVDTFCFIVSGSMA